MSEPEAIKARFQVTKQNVVVTATFHDSTVVLQWRHSEDAARHIKVLISNLPELVTDGMREIQVQRAMFGVDDEYRDLFPDLPTEGDAE